MKKINLFIITVAILSAILISMTSCNMAIIDVDKTNDNIREGAEKAYFEGQKDAITGDVRIQLNCDSVYVWTRSCWNDGSKPIFNPTRLDTKNNVKWVFYG